MSTGLRQRKKTETRLQLQSTAIRLFGERGFDEVTVADIAAQANYSPATFFRYFNSKAGAVFAYSSLQLKELQARLDARPADQSALDTVHAVWHEQIETLNPDNDMFRAQQELVERYPPVADEQAAIFRTGRDMLAPALRTDEPNRSDVEIEMIASVAFDAIFSSLRVWAKQGGDLAQTFEESWNLVRRIASR